MTHDQAVTLLDTAYRQGMREIFVQADLFDAYQQGLATMESWRGALSVGSARSARTAKNDVPTLMFRDAQVKLMVNEMKR